MGKLLVKRILFSLVGIVSGCLLSLAMASSALAYAYHATPIDAGYNTNLISDAAFTAKNTMTTEEIQAFLVSKMPVCDTWGQKYIYDSVKGYSVTRAQYSLDRGVSTPFVCLKDYTEGGKTAAQIIKDAANDYDINPQVILVTLEKEQSLIRDDWPWQWNYNRAMGMGCPESGGCDAVFAGFTNQIRSGSRLLKAVYNKSCNPDTGPFYEFTFFNTFRGVPRVLDGVSTSIDTCATAALYQYTPHRPDSAWIDRWYVDPDTGVGSWVNYYGNYNFVTYFKNWFPDAYGFGYNFDVTQSLYLSSVNPLEGENVMALYKVKNTSNLTYTVSFTIVDYAVDVRGWNSFSYQTVTLAPGEEYIYQATRLAKYAGRHQLELALGYNGGAYSLASTTGKLVKFNYSTRAFNPGSIIITKSMWLSNTDPFVGDRVSGFYEVKNINSSSITLDLALVDYATDAKNWNSYPYTRVTIAANSTAQFSGSHISQFLGLHHAWLAYVYNGTAYNFSTNGQLADFWYRTRTIDSSAFSVTKSMWLSNVNPAVGTDVSGFYEVKNNTNNSLTINMALVDYAVDAKGWNSYPYKQVTIAPGATAQFTGTRTQKFQGLHHTWLAFIYNGNAYNFTGNNGQLVDFWYSAR